MSKKLFCLVLIISFVAMLFVGCSGNANENSNKGDSVNSNTDKPGKESPPEPQDEPQSPYGDTGGIKLPLVDKPTTIKWMVQSETPDLKDILIVKEIEKRTGITIELQGYSHAMYNDKLKIVMASGKLPDIFHGLSLAEANKLGSQGALVSINQYADQLPNFQKLYMEENDWVMKSYTDDKNDLYTWPIYGVSRDVNHGFLYRKDIFDKHGIKEWTDTEGFYQALKKLKEFYPNSYPVASKTKETIFSDWAHGWGIGGTGYPLGAFPAYFDENTNMWKLATTQPEYKDMIDFMKKLYNEGLLDPEFLTDTPASWTAKMTANDKAFVTFDWIGRLDLFYEQIKSENPDYNLRYGYPVGPTGNIRTLSKVTSSGVHVANNNNKEVALKLLDYLSSPSGAELVTVGVEGEIFTWDDSGVPMYPELKDVVVDISVLRDRYGLWLPNMYVRADQRSVYYNFTEKQQEAQDKINQDKRFEPIDPILKLKDEETSIIADLMPSLDKSAKEFSVKYILNKSDGEKEWQEWLKNAEKLGASEIVEVYNTAQKRFDKGN